MKTITFLVSAILTLGSCTSNLKSKETFTLEDQVELQHNMLSTVHDNDNVYRSQFYNTTQALVRKSFDNETFWDTTASDPIWDDCKYLAANTKYWRIYYTSKKEQTQYIKYFENTHHLISEQEYDLKPLHDQQITIEL